MASGSGMMRAAKLAEAPTPFQAALRRVKSEAALATLGSLVKNVAMFPNVRDVPASAVDVERA